LRQESLLGTAIRLLRPFWPFALGATVFGALSGVATAWLLATINHAFHSSAPIGPLLLGFGGLVVFILVGEIISDLGNAFVGQQIVATLRKELTDKVLTAPIDSIERFRLHRIIAALNQDIDAISSFTFVFSSIAIATSVTIGCIVYLVILSPTLFAIAAIALAIGVTISTYARRQGTKGFQASRDAADDLQKHYRSITEGAKELRINRQRRAQVHSVQLARTIDRMRDLQIRAMRIFMGANALSDAVFWMVIALLVGAQAGLAIDKTVLSGFVLVLLYVKGPLDQVIGAFPLFARTQVSLKRVAELSREFANPEPHLLIGDQRTVSLEPGSIDLVDVHYVFPAVEGTSPFVLGPITLSVRAGEILFIVGENGSGKTTLIKLILGLYAPQAGKVLLNGEEVGPDRRDEYRQLFSAVFFDYYLFDDVIVPDGVVAEAVGGYLQKLEIAHKVGVENGRFTTTDLSAGQRKRLALIQVYLEGRPVIVFDEWAAEQDPTFRRIFYTEILPDLKRQGKTLIVISHDDRYFGAADRVVRLEQGKIAELFVPANRVAELPVSARPIDHKEKTA
jgi:putative ATP-binding cassette transporter